MMMALRFRRVFGSFRQRCALRREMGDAVVADIAHELQTPIAILRGNFEILRRTDAGAADRVRAGRVIETTLDGMTRLVRGALDGARAGSPERAFPKKDVSLRSLLDEAVEDCSILAQDRGIALSVANDGRLPSDDLFIRADRDKIKEVLLNLVSNAFKHTPPGGAVMLGAERAEAMARVTVEDSGAGIAPAELSRIFERFYRIRSDAADPLVPGTGIGLHICRAIVEAHGGHIGVRSRLGKGSRFTVLLPLRESSLASAPGAHRALSVVIKP